MTNMLTQALRILKLLEEHHHRLADIIKTKDLISHQIREAAETDKHTTESQDKHVDNNTDPLPATDATSHSARPSASTLAKMQRQRRDTSPALAKDMASRRGIPQPQPKRIHPSVEGKPAVVANPDLSAPKRKHSSKHREVVEAPSASSAAQLPQQSNATTDDAFSRFYSTLTAGPLSKISSMLAFTALPLTETPSQPTSPTSSRTESVKAHNGPDLHTLISPAALRALEDQQRRQGATGHVFNPAESFYVVQPSGGTASYANIMRSEQQRYAKLQQHHLSGISEEDGEFVDARETQAAPKTNAGASTSHGRAVRRPGMPPSHTPEELELENETLKQVLDQMSHRLQAFERSAQDASMAVLTQSMASVRTQGGPSPKHDEAELGERARMEAEMQSAVDEITKLRRDNQKYKNYFDRLKDSARKKDSARQREGERSERGHSIA